MDGQTNGQTNGRNYTDIERNLAMMVICVLVSLNSIGQTSFKLESGNKNVDRQMDGQTNEQTELHQFRKEPSYNGDLSPCQV